MDPVYPALLYAAVALTCFVAFVALAVPAQRRALASGSPSTDVEADDVLSLPRTVASGALACALWPVVVVILTISRTARVEQPSTCQGAER